LRLNILYLRVIKCSIYFPVIEEGQACGCDMTMSCLGECKPGLECTFDDVSAGHGICTKTKK